jgi:hypothetical protein
MAAGSLVANRGRLFSVIELVGVSRGPGLLMCVGLLLVGASTGAVHAGALRTHEE